MAFSAETEVKGIALSLTRDTNDSGMNWLLDYFTRNWFGTNKDGEGCFVVSIRMHRLLKEYLCTFELGLVPETFNRRIKKPFYIVGRGVSFRQALGKAALEVLELTKNSKGDQEGE